MCVLYFDFETQDDGIASGMGSGWVHDMSEILCMGYAIDDLPVTCTRDRDLMCTLIRNAQTLVSFNAEYELGNLKYDLGIEFKRKKNFDVFVAAKMYRNVPPINYYKTKKGKELGKWGYSLDFQSAYHLNVTGSDKKATDALIKESIKLGIISTHVNTKLKKDGTMGKRALSNTALKSAMFSRLRILFKMNPDIVMKYCEIDVDLTRRLHKFFLSRGLNKELYALYSELPKVIVEMKRKGVRVDVERAIALRDKYIIEEEDLREECISLMEEPINLNSPKQKLEYAIKYNIPLKEDSSKASGYTTGEEWIVSIEEQYPWARKLSDALKTKKFIGTYLKPIIEKSVNGRLHMNLNLMEARTGRFSSSDPNLQNLPNAYTQKGKEIRSLFLADEGKEFKCIDFSGQEWRILIHLAKLCEVEKVKYKEPRKLAYEDYADLTKEQKDEARSNHGHLLAKEWTTFEDPLIDIMIQGYEEDPDFDCHTVNRKNIYKVSGLDMFSDDNAEEGRNITKTTTYGALYGQQTAGLAKKLGCDEKTSRLILNSFYEGVPFIKKLSDYLTYTAITRGYIRSMTGRSFQFATPLYKLLNYDIQGSAFDQCGISMIQAYHIGIVPSMQVHDELNSGDWSDEEADMMSFIMENSINLYIPSLAEVGTGPNWAEAK
jgi:DNA polymerase-1